MHFALAREMVESLELWLANMAQWKIQVKSILKWAKSKASSVFWLARIPLRELHLAAAAAEKMHSRNHRSPTPALGKKIRKNSAEEIHTNNGGVVWYYIHSVIWIEVKHYGGTMNLATNFLVAGRGGEERNNASVTAQFCMLLPIICAPITVYRPLSPKWNSLSLLYGMVLWYTILLTVFKTIPKVS